VAGGAISRAPHEARVGPGRAAPLFVTAAVFNWLVALSLALPGERAWQLAGLAQPADPLFLHLFLTFVALFGIAYLWIGVAPAGKDALVVIGAVGKASAFAVLFGHYLAGSVPAGVAALGAGDLVFAALFVRFLFRAGQGRGAP